VPVVATPVDGTKELIKNHHTGEFIEVKNPENMAKVVSTLICNPYHRRMLAIRALGYVNDNFRMEHQIKKIQKVYTSLV